MHDGYPMLAKPDGMGTFPINKKTTAIFRNHELSRRYSKLNNINDELMFNPEARGGVSRLIWDEHEKIVDSSLVLMEQTETVQVVFLHGGGFLVKKVLIVSMVTFFFVPQSKEI